MSWYGRGGGESSVEECIEPYLRLNPQLVKRRQDSTLVKSLEELRDILGVFSISELIELGRGNRRKLLDGLQLFVNQLVEKGLSPKSIRFRLYLLRSFLDYYEISIPERKVKLPKKSPRRIDRIPSLSELQRLIMATRSRRMRLLLHLLPLTGLRLGEALKLRVEYIDLENNTIHLPGEITKSGYPRDVPIFSELKAELERYIHEAKLNRGYVFHVNGDPEKPIPKNRFYEEYGALLKRLGLDMKTPDGSAYVLHPHVFRNWFRTQLEGAGVNKQLIDLWMEHNTGMVEKVYYLPQPEMIKAEMEKADKAMRIFGALYTPLESEKVKALEEAVEFYERLTELIAKKNPRLLKELGLSD
ncbi:MAG: tyrosine-type recombinase/integrase [Aigarchaeota archaeon]|nr:tyrosine-type recombinase/integrase [Candidatus Pelearchaeum maunauluense]